jgi:4-hydroxybenzoate polyprenyltransferase
VLSVTFSFGVLIGFAAVLNELPVSAYLLYLLTACWIFMFDTIYALVDQEDDEQLLLFSSAISLGKNTKTTIYALMGLTQLLWLLIAHQLKLDGFFCIGWLLGSCCFLYQVMLISNDTRESYFKAFLNNNWYGLVILLSLLVGLQQHW